MRKKLSRIGLGYVALALWAPSAWAADPAPEVVDLGADEPGADGDEFTQKTDTEDELSANEPVPAVLPPEEEDPDAWQFTIGARYRLIVVPQFLINAFGVQGGTNVVANGVGAEFGLAKKQYEFMLAGWYASYPMSNTPFKAPGDGPSAWEMWNSSAGAFFITAEFALRNEITKGWDWTVGASGGLGIVTGSLQRRETYWLPPFSETSPGGEADANTTTLGVCNAPGDPVPACEPGDYTNAAPWPVYPWLSFQTGIRYQPVRNFVARLDLGAGSSGFWLGLGADYGL